MGVLEMTTQEEMREHAEDMFFDTLCMCYFRQLESEPVRIFGLYNGDGVAMAVGSMFDLTRFRMDIGFIEVRLH